MWMRTVRTVTSLKRDSVVIHCIIMSGNWSPLSNPCLIRCPGVHSRQKVIKKFLGHPCIKPSLHSYYLPPKEATAQQLLIEGLRSDLAGVKGI